MLAVTTGSLAKVIVLCTTFVMMCCIKPYWNACADNDAIYVHVHHCLVVERQL